MKNSEWSKKREAEIKIVQDLMDNPKSYSFTYGVEKDNKLIQKGLKSYSIASKNLFILEEADTKKRNALRLSAKAKFDIGKLTKKKLRLIISDNSVIPKFSVVHTSKIMKPAIKKRVNKILSKK